MKKVSFPELQMIQNFEKSDFGTDCICAITCADPKKSNFDIFLVDEGREDSYTKCTTISGTSSVRQRNAILMAFRLWADDGPSLNAG